jgi:hypothetical protein
MEMSGSGPRLIIMCGLPGSGKTTRAKALQNRLGAVRFCPDEWMDALSLNLHDEERRGKIEALQWKLARELLALGLGSHRMGNLGKVREGCLAARSTSPWRRRGVALSLCAC